MNFIKNVFYEGKKNDQKNLNKLSNICLDYVHKPHLFIYLLLSQHTATEAVWWCFIATVWPAQYLIYPGLQKNKNWLISGTNMLQFGRTALCTFTFSSYTLPVSSLSLLLCKTHIFDPSTHICINYAWGERGSFIVTLSWFGLFLYFFNWNGDVGSIVPHESADWELGP